MTREQARPRAGVPVLHAVTDDGVLARPDFADLAATIMETGGSRTALHLRGPRTEGSALFRLARRLKGVASASGALLVVNDRVDVALAVGTSSVQLGWRSLPPTDARRILGPDARVGVSTHSDEEVAAACADGAWWIFTGTIYATPSHPEGGARGSGAITGACRAAAGVPVLGIGGITPGRVAEVRRAGAHGVAVIRGIWDARSPHDALNRYLDALAALAGEEGDER